MKKRDSQGLVFFTAPHELLLADQRMAAVKKIVADNPLLSLFGMDNATDEEVTERSYSRFPLGQYSQQKRVSRVNVQSFRLPLTLFFLWLLGN